MKKLQATNIVLGYGAASPIIVNNVTITLVPGEFAGVIGPNGSGKSTLVRALSRVLAPSSGAVLLSGRNLYDQVTARESAASIAAAPQSAPPAFDFTVRELVAMGRAPHQSRSPFARSTPEDADIVDTALHDMGVLDYADRAASTLSGGEQQRVVLARALAQQPRILLLDEPTAHLDLRHQTDILRLVRDRVHSRGMAALAVLHDINLAASYCDRLFLLHDGQLVAHGTPAEVLTEEHIHAAYGTRVWVRCHPVTGSPLVLTLPDLAVPKGAAPPAGAALHVLCGAGTGAGLMLRLQRLGYRVTAGVLNTGDTDQEAAEMLGIPYASESPFSAFSAEAVEQANSLLQHCDAIIITDVPFGPANLPNLQLAARAAAEGRRVLALSAPGCAEFASRDFTGGVATALWTELLAHGMRTAADADSLLDLVPASAAATIPNALLNSIR